MKYLLFAFLTLKVLNGTSNLSRENLTLKTRNLKNYQRLIMLNDIFGSMENLQKTVDECKYSALIRLSLCFEVNMSCF